MVLHGVVTGIRFFAISHKIMSPVKRNLARQTPDLNALLQQQARYIPVLGTLRFFWRELKEMQVWWPILLPFLAWIGWRTYQQERQKVLQARQRHTVR
jgi:hypothetical protein